MVTRIVNSPYTIHTPFPADNAVISVSTGVLTLNRFRDITTAYNKSLRCKLYSMQRN